MNNEKIKELKNMTTQDFYDAINSDGNNEIKDWLAKLGAERINEIFDPSIMLERATNMYREMGYSEEWIRNKLSSDLKK